MSDLKIRVRYHEIEVEVSIPKTPLTVINPNGETCSTIMELLKDATDKIEQLIMAGRKEVKDVNY